MEDKDKTNLQGVQPKSNFRQTDNEGEPQGTHGNKQDTGGQYGQPGAEPEGGVSRGDEQRSSASDESDGSTQ